MKEVKDKRIVFIFDECHRSQFGETHLAITRFFTKNQMIGFTGTPIFAENAVGNKLGKRTTTELFDKALHKYVITDAIADDNVLKFSVEYIGKYKEKEKENSATNIDIDVENIDTKELLESPQRIEKIVDYIIANHARKTHSKEFTAMMCVSSVDVLSTYYELFRSKKHNLKIATIFSFNANEDDKDATGVNELDESDGASVDEANINMHSRDKLESYIGDYNAAFGTKFTTRDTQSYYNYYNDISKKVKNREIDILLVVNMFLTGFDSPQLNTLYVDKNLKYHGLIQAFSRTNRILNEKKSQGNIVCFRNLKQNTDDAIALFSNLNAKDIILMKPYEEYVNSFNEAFGELLEIAPTLESVDELRNQGEKRELAFIQAFRKLMRLKNILESFSDFKWSDLEMSHQQFEDYKSKYLDIYEKINAEKGEGAEKVSILDDVDFELELIHKDEINVLYILQLLARYKDADEDEKEEHKNKIISIMNSKTQLRSKKELIEKFINENMLHISDSDDIENEFEKFWEEEKELAYNELCSEENLDCAEVRKVVDTYVYEERPPLKNDVAKTLKLKPKLLERKVIVPRVLEKIVKFVDKFYDL